MITELGHFCLVLAMLIAFLQSVVPLVGTRRNSYGMMSFGSVAANLQFALLLVAFASLTHAFVTSDFSVRLVALNSHSLKPLLYKISGVWGNHEGSMLLWVLILALFGASAVWFGSNLPIRLKATVLSVQGAVGLAFLIFIVFTSNPFLRIFPIPFDGQDLNPLLQDPGLAFHPPFLYLGYVGLSMSFSFAVAALIEGRIDAAWGRWVRPWTLAAWLFLTIGIALGSWWAYYELGWGGFWFWDPVENASFIPWLCAAALLHSAIVVEKRENLKSWTILLAILAFGFSLTGTFIVRSGLLTSVHAFASDPARGVFILTFLFIVTASSLFLFAIKHEKIENNKYFFLFSREGGLLLNNIFFCASALTILVGTLWPLIIEVTTGRNISVGAPFFNLVFLPIILPAIFLTGVSINLKWKVNTLEYILKKFWKILSITIFIVGCYLFIFEGPVITFLCISLSIWIIITVFNDLIGRIYSNKIGVGLNISRLLKINYSTYGMYLAHLGVAIFILGVAISEAEKKYFEGALEIGDDIIIDKFKIAFKDVKNEKLNNWISEVGSFSVTEENKISYKMFAERRVYLDTGMPTTEAAIKRNYFSHLYIVMGQEQPANSGKRIVRIYYNPLVIFIWIGAFIMAIGGIIALLERTKSKNILSKV
mgnify:CR=1 FL=1